VTVEDGKTNDNWLTCPVVRHSAPWPLTQ